MQTQPMEDIDAVLGRFQAWVGARNAVEVKPGVRELTYEEALQSSRYRRRGASALPIKNSKAETGTRSTAALDTTAEQEPTRTAAPVKDRDAKLNAGRKRRAAKASKPAANPPFRDVLAEVVVAARPAEITRHTAVSIRLAPDERALIRTRAAEAGISASAYMRQCALEVEHLRTQVEQALAAVERSTPASIQAPAPVPARGFFARLAQMIF